MQALTAISPIDGRYRDKVESLANYFSESALIRYRVMVEIEYFISLCEIPLPQLKQFDHKLFDNLKEIYLNFTIDDAQRVKDIEKITNHDVKAVEYFIKEKFDTLNLHEYKEFIHFGLTSQDINNTAVPCSLRDAVHDVYYPLIDELIAKLEELAEEWKDVPMLAKTHGQPASPTARKRNPSIRIPTDPPSGTVKESGLLRQIRRCHREFQRPPRRIPRN